MNKRQDILHQPLLEVQFDGVIEAGCRAVVAQRLKLSGMRWSLRGATGIATLRCQDASGRWEENWKLPRTQTSVA